MNIRSFFLALPLSLLAGVAVNGSEVSLETQTFRDGGDLAYLTGKTQRIEEGTSMVEVMNTLNRGIAIGGPVDIIVFYAGAEGVPTTVLPDSGDAATWPFAKAK